MQGTIAPNQARMAHVDLMRGIVALLVVFAQVSTAFVRLPEVQAHGTLLLA